MLKPPEDVAPEVLFRTLLGLPRPSVDIEYRLPAAPAVALRVQAVTAAELAGKPQELAAAALLVGRQRAFRTANEAASLLTETELYKLIAAIERALPRCSPVDGRSDPKPWTARLLDGARHVTNRRAACVLGSQMETIGTYVVDRPERYFGVAAAELVDAHWFAYRAARALFFESQNARR